VSPIPRDLPPALSPSLTLTNTRPGGQGAQPGLLISPGVWWAEVCCGKHVPAVVERQGLAADGHTDRRSVESAAAKTGVPEQVVIFEHHQVRRMQHVLARACTCTRTHGDATIGVISDRGKVVSQPGASRPEFSSHPAGTVFFGKV
jgi:hypothetical protein